MRALSNLAVAGALLSLDLACGAAWAEASKRKPGLWEIAVTTAGQPSAYVSQVCIGTDDDLGNSAGTANASADCTESSATRDGDKIIVRSVCPLRSSTVTTEAVIVGDLDSAYQGQIEANYSPPLYGRSQVQSTVQAKWIGPCQ